MLPASPCPANPSVAFSEPSENERRGMGRSILDHLQLCGWRFDHYPPPRDLACSPAGTHARNACAYLLP